MNYLKTFEMFDTEDLKSSMELDYIKGILNPLELSKIEKNDSFNNIINLLILKFPFFKECLNKDNPYAMLGENKYSGDLVFIFKNENWGFNS